MRHIIISVICLFAINCSSSSPKKDGFSTDQTLVQDLSDSFIEHDINDLLSVDSVKECVEGDFECIDISNERECIKDADGRERWTTRTCQSGFACLADRCVDECADECTHEEERTVGANAEKCLPFKLETKAQTSINSDLLHDRARLHNAWSFKHHFPAFTILDIYHATDEYQGIAGYRSRDSALFTGNYMAAEALRALVTESDDAEAKLQWLTESIHQLFDVTGHRGFLSRFTAPLSHPDPVVVGMYNPARKDHHKKNYKNEDWFWIGYTSRDQYQGVMMGYGWAYQALKSQKHKDLIRNDIIAVCEELIKVRKIDVTFRINYQGNWYQFDKEMEFSHVILNPTEYLNGKPYIQFGSEADPGDWEDSSMNGIREFWPDYSDVLKQLPVIGFFFQVPLYRSGSTIMLAAALRLGMMVTKDDPKYATQYQAFKNHYDKNFDKWLKSIESYIHLNTHDQCWKKYYGLNIVWQPLWTLLRLEDDPQRRDALLKVAENRMYSLVKDHKNVFFDYIFASQMPYSTDMQIIIDKATHQLSQFMDPPKHHTLVDHSDIYEPDPDCPGLSKTAVDVQHRNTGDFIWQFSPFRIADAGKTGAIYPGTDYVLAYWMARYYGWLDDDSKGSCLRWQDASKN